jgi:hypothetical protein
VVNEVMEALVKLRGKVAIQDEEPTSFARKAIA